MSKEFNSFLPFWTLLKKEVLRFLSVSIQTMITPVISVSLYLFIFGNLGRSLTLFQGISFIQFVVPGLVVMGVINNSFANSSSSLFFSRYLGNIVDLLVTPITPAQFIAAYTLAAMLRGLIVGSIVLVISIFFTGLPWAHPLEAAAMLVLASFLFAQLGLVAAIYSNSFDHLSMYTNFLILPLTYLGGLFYPISSLPGIWLKISHGNPIYYLMDGFRGAVLGGGETPLSLDFAIAGALSFILFVWAAILIRSGHRMRN